MRFLKLVLCVFCIFTGTYSFAGEAAKGYKAHIYIIYNDMDVFRRSLDSAPQIGSGAEDFVVRVGCLGKDDCFAKVPSIRKLIATKKEIDSSCKLPIYARIKFSVAAEVYGDLNNNDETYDFDYSGTCLIFEGRYFKLKKSVFKILLKNPIAKW